MTIQLDTDEKFKSFQYAKITCGQEIKEGRGLGDYFKGKSITEILNISFDVISKDLNPQTDEDQFVLYLEWDALRSALALYAGIEDDHIDPDRCEITSIEHSDEGIEVAEVILPPKELPKILPCSLAEQRREAN